MDRSRGLRVSKTKTPTCHGWRSVRDILGGPGRNRTTDTRIFNPRINAVTATCFERARDEAAAAEAAVMAGEPLGLLHGLPIGIKDLEETDGLLTTYGSPIYREQCAGRDNALVARAARGRRHRRRQDQRARDGRRRQHAATRCGAPPAIRSIRRSMPAARRAARRRRWPATCCRCAPAPTPAVRCAFPAAKCGVVGFRPSPGLVPSERKLLGWTPISVVGPMGRTVADTCLQLGATAGTRHADPLSYPVDAAGLLRARGPRPGAAARGLHRGLRRLRRSTTASARCSARRSPRCAICSRLRRGQLRRSARRTAASTCCAPRAFVAGYRGGLRARPGSLGPNMRANYEMGAAHDAGRRAWAQAEQTRIFRRFQAPSATTT